MEKTWGRYQTKPEGCLENFYQIGFHISQYVILCHNYLYIYICTYISLSSNEKGIRLQVHLSVARLATILNSLTSFNFFCDPSCETP
jgi:hypothetical protein